MSEEKKSRLKSIRKNICGQSNKLAALEKDFNHLEKNLDYIISSDDVIQETLVNFLSIYMQINRILEKANRESRKINDEMKTLNAEFSLSSKTIDTMSKQSYMPSKGTMEKVGSVGKFVVDLAVGGAVSTLATTAYKVGKVALHKTVNKVSEFQEEYEQCHYKLALLQYCVVDLQKRANAKIVGMSSKLSYLKSLADVTDPEDTMDNKLEFGRDYEVKLDENLNLEEIFVYNPDGSCESVNSTIRLEEDCDDAENYDNDSKEEESWTDSCNKEERIMSLKNKLANVESELEFLRMELKKSVEDNKLCKCEVDFYKMQLAGMQTHEHSITDATESEISDEMVYTDDGGFKTQYDNSIAADTVKSGKFAQKGIVIVIFGLATIATFIVMR